MISACEFDAGGADIGNAAFADLETRAIHFTSDEFEVDVDVTDDLVVPDHYLG